MNVLGADDILKNFKEHKSHMGRRLSCPLVFCEDNLLHIVTFCVIISKHGAGQNPVSRSYISQ